MQFLRHVERTRLLVHLLEIEPADGSDPVENYRVVRRELENYSRDLAEKPEVIAVSKMDLLTSDEDRATAQKMIEQELGRPVMRISSATGEGLPELLEQCWKMLREIKEKEELERSPANCPASGGRVSEEEG